MLIRRLLTFCVAPPTHTATTYDDGPYQWHSYLASKYTAAGHKITFFLNGNNYDW